MSGGGVSEAAQALGRELRRLRLQRGLSQRALTKSLGLSAHSNIADYESGRRIPPRDIVSACDRLLRTDGELGRLLTRALAEKALGARADDPPPPHTNIQSQGRLARHRRAWAVAALAIPAVAVFAWSLPRPEVHQATRRPAPSIWDGNDPKAAGCAADAITLQAQPVLSAAGRQLGAIHLRYSPACRAAWAKFEPLPAKPDGPVMVTVEAVRPADGMRTMFQFPGWDQVYGDLLRTATGCVQATATVRLTGEEATASTGCLTA
jgi:transcriptional regulator with XRE-family HTH domain